VIIAVPLVLQQYKKCDDEEIRGRYCKKEYEKLSEDFKKDCKKKMRTDELFN
jgi:hypothetical protein